MTDLHSPANRPTLQYLVYPQTVKCLTENKNHKIHHTQIPPFIYMCKRMPRMIINRSTAHFLRATLMVCSGDILGGSARDRSKTQGRTLKSFHPPPPPSPPQLSQGGKVQSNARIPA